MAANNSSLLKGKKFPPSKRQYPLVSHYGDFFFGCSWLGMSRHFPRDRKCCVCIYLHKHFLFGG